MTSERDIEERKEKSEKIALYLLVIAIFCLLSFAVIAAYDTMYLQSVILLEIMLGGIAGSIIVMIICVVVFLCLSGGKRKFMKIGKP